MSGFFEGLYIPPWKKFGDYEIKVAGMTSVHFFRDISDGVIPKKDNGVTIFLAGNTRIDLTGEDFEEFRNWWQQEKENCGINEDS